MRWELILCATLLGCAHEAGAEAPAVPPEAPQPTPAAPAANETVAAPSATAPALSATETPPPSASTLAASGPPTRLTPSQIRNVVVAHSGAIRACYERELPANPTLKGYVVLAWRVLPDGSVTAPVVAKSTLNSSPAEECMLRQVGGWHFPASETPTDVPSFPFGFALTP